MPTAQALLFFACIGAFFLVLAMFLHYIVRTGARHDRLCIFALLTAFLGLLQSAHLAQTSRDIFYTAAPAFALFAFALVAWREGLSRFRNAP
jgi:uncharacterized membrane protein